jgi:hypothetical protein
MKTVYSDPPNREKKGLFCSVGQGVACVSRKGLTDILSINFSGCMGVIISSKKQPGVVVGHVSQGGYGNTTWSAYSLESVQQLLLLAKKHVDAKDTLSLILTNSGDQDLGLIKALQDQHLEITDLRADRKKSDAFFLDAQTKTLHLWRGGPDRFKNIGDRWEEFEELKLKFGGELSVKCSQKKMPYYLMD